MAAFISGAGAGVEHLRSKRLVRGRKASTTFAVASRPTGKRVASVKSEVWKFMGSVYMCTSVHIRFVLVHMSAAGFEFWKRTIRVFTLRKYTGYHRETRTQQAKGIIGNLHKQTDERGMESSNGLQPAGRVYPKFGSFTKKISSERRHTHWTMRRPVYSWWVIFRQQERTTSGSLSKLKCESIAYKETCPLIPLLLQDSSSKPV